MSNNRDTKFQGFAKALNRELSTLALELFARESHIDAETIDSENEQVIARRAYDLVKHTIIDLQYDDDRHADNWAQKISDMTQWPLEDNKNE